MEQPKVVQNHLNFLFCDGNSEATGSPSSIVHVETSRRPRSPRIAPFWSIYFLVSGKLASFPETGQFPGN